MGKNRIKLENHCSQIEKYFSPKKLFFLLFSLFIFTQTLFSEVSNTTITIDNARQTLYKKDPDSGNDLIQLEGDVSLSVQKDKTTSTITADRITYDRKTEMLCAEGNVAIVTKGSGSGDDTATANSLLLNTSTMEAVFDGGRIVQTQSDAMNLNGSTLIVFSKNFGRSESNVIAFKNSSLTFCDDDDPHWKINATRTWLLPGGEFAFFNAVLFVGEIPVLYLPAFYYPKDELIFNPVFGMTKRKGMYNQNTFYFYGRKSSSNSTASNSSSSSSTTSDAATDATLKGIYNFMKPSTLKEQRREGLMLHNLDDNFSGDTSHYVKVMADWYQNLGYMLGVDGVLAPTKTYLTDLKFGLKLGLSNTIYVNGDSYSFLDTNGLKTMDDSCFLGLQLPFRYSGNLSLTLAKPFSLTLTMPFYSDPYFNTDFNSRSESMDWISYVMGLFKDGEDDTSVSATSSFTWQLTGKYSPKIPEVISPYISSVSTNFSSSVIFSTPKVEDVQKGLSELIKKEGSKYKNYTSEWINRTPRRQFYYPSQVTPINASASLSGTLFKYSSTAVKKSSSKNITFVAELAKPQELKTTKEIEAEEEKKRQKEESEKTEEEKSEEENTELAENSEQTETSETENASSDELFEYKPDLPKLTKSSSSTNSLGGTTYNLSYSVAPNFVTQFAYNSSNLTKSEDFDWSKVKAFMYTFKSPVSLNSKLYLLGDFVSLTNSLAYSPVVQGHPYINVNEIEKRENETDEEYTKRKSQFWGYSESDAKTLVKADYAATSQTVTSSNTLTFKPFTYTSRFSDSNIGITSNFKLLRWEFNSSKMYLDSEKYNSDNREDWEQALRDAFQLYTLNRLDQDSVDDDDKNDPEDFFTSNSVNMTLATSQKNNTIKESLSLSSVIWPLTPKYSGTFSLSFPYTTLSFGTAYVQTQKEIKDKSQPEIWEMDPFTQSLSFSHKLLNSTFSFSESLSWDPLFDYSKTTSIKDEDGNEIKDENGEVISEYNDSSNWFNKNLSNTNSFQSLKLSTSWNGISVSYVMSYALGADLAKNGHTIDDGWINREKKEFLPYSLSFSYSSGSKTLFSNSTSSLVVGFSTSVYVDMIKYTNSYFSFVPSITLKTKPVNITFSSTSKNSVLYWYFHDDIKSYQLGNNWAENIFLDLARSFYFWDESSRKASGFKLKSLSMTMSRDLHDWKFAMSLSVSPRLVNKKYRFDPYMTIGIVWNPMDSIKTQIVDKYGEWTLN